MTDLESRLQRLAAAVKSLVLELHLERHVTSAHPESFEDCERLWCAYWRGMLSMAVERGGS